MRHFFENWIVDAWNRRRTPEQASGEGLDLGSELRDGVPTGSRVVIPEAKRAEHIAVLGKTGQGKSKLINYFEAQDIRRGQGFCAIDLHGDATPFLLGTLAAEERRRGVDLSHRVILIEPGDPEFSAGINLLEAPPGQDLHTQIAEFASVLRHRWKLDTLGARTEELLRASLHVLADAGMTIVDLPLLLTNDAFRARCVAASHSPEIATYFTERFDQLTPPMQAAYRDPILNKVSPFVTDPKLRHLTGQRGSTFSLGQAIDAGSFLILHLDKGRLGEQAATFAGLFLAKLKNAFFARRDRRIFTLYCDEVQNLVYDTGLETLFSEARKFQVSIVSANQFTQQYSDETRAAILATGTQVLFQLSSADAEKFSTALDGGRRMAEHLRNLPRRHIVVKSGSLPARTALVAEVRDLGAAWDDLRRRCRARWTRRRTQIEAEIQARRAQPQRQRETLDDWD